MGPAGGKPAPGTKQVKAPSSNLLKGGIGWLLVRRSLRYEFWSFPQGQFMRGSGTGWGRPVPIKLAFCWANLETGRPHPFHELALSFPGAWNLEPGYLENV